MHSNGAEHGVRPHLLVSAPYGKEVMWVRPAPLILGKEFAEEGGGAVSHPDGQPGGAGSMFIPQLACQADLPGLSIWPDVQIRFGMAQGIEFGAKSVFPAQELFLAE